MANLGVLEKFGVKFIDSKLKKTSYAIDDERQGLVIIKDGIKTPLYKDEIQTFAEELKGIYEAFLELRM